MLTVSYDTSLVVISLLVAIVASYTALDMAGRIASARHAAKLLWIGGGAVAMGFGIWSMHFVGMLAFSLPIPLGYDVARTGLSLLIAIVASGAALWLVSRPRMSTWHLALGALAMGGAISAMHYVGMSAMMIQPGIEYDPMLFVLSILIAVLASGAALWIAFRLRRNTPYVRAYRAGAAVIMGAAIVGMHYTGMAASKFPIGSYCAAANSGLDSGWLAGLIIVTTFAVLAIALLTSILDARMEARTALLSSSLARANDELRRLALHDDLTGLPNRVLLNDRVEQKINKARRNGGLVALMYMDLDGFKMVNDAFGHHVGDRLLVDVSTRLVGTLRSEDTLARVGGDEFVLVAEVRSKDDAARLADQIIARVGGRFDTHGHELRVSASIGIAFYPGDGEDHHDLMMNADAAMYHAKSVGKSRHSRFDRSMNTNALIQFQTTSDLRTARENGELRLFYQPKFAADDGRMVGVEALLRWQHPVRGLLLPDQFIAIAEKTGLIIDIGEWVLDEACRQMHEWLSRGCLDWRVAVNLSALQLCHAGLVDVVSRSLEKHGVPANSLTLEITETTAMTDAHSSLHVLEHLANMGIDISIDDFGTGHSSLLYLKRLPARELKIDRGFVRDLERDRGDAAIVTAIIALGQALDLRIVAEGVETEQQREFLTRLGCDALQGFLLGRPVPADQIALPPMSPHAPQVAGR